MDSERAKEVLLLYRPGTADDEDPEFREALDLARRDPELRQWFDEHSARQSMIRNRLKEIAVPAELKQQILERIAVRDRVTVWWQQPVWRVLAAAAVIVLLIGVTWFLPRPDPGKSFAAYRQRMVGDIQRMYPAMDMVTTNMAGILEYLAQKQDRATYVLPQPLKKLPGIGCAVLDWRSRKVSLICLDAGQQKELYLWIVDRTVFSDPPPVDQPQFGKKIGGLTSASWSHDDKAYILAGPGSEEFIKRFL